METIIRLKDVKENRVIYLDKENYIKLTNNQQEYRKRYNSRDTTGLELKTPYPGNYISGAQINPRKLQGAMEVSIPGRTLEPWQIHYRPFEEHITIKSGTIFLNKLEFEESGIKTGNYTYQAGDEIVIPEYVPHQLGNPEEELLKIVAEFSPGPKWNESLEPEFPDVNSCMSALYRKLLSYRKVEEYVATKPKEKTRFITKEMNQMLKDNPEAKTI